MTNVPRMVFNRWMDAILHYFGGRDEQNTCFSALRDFGVAAQNLAGQKYHYFTHHDRQNNVKSHRQVNYHYFLIQGMS